jgi:hypothetical protein
MVQAILEDRKRQTRRVVKGHVKMFDYIAATDIPCPFGKVGDVLWVRETFFDSDNYKYVPLFVARNRYLFKADDDFIGDHKWKPSIHMPFEACRLFLEIANIRVERLQDISENDSKNEGIQEFTKDGVGFKYGLDGWHWSSSTGKPFMCYNRKIAFGELWQSINGAESWNSNPWVWVIEFKQIPKPIALLAPTHENLQADSSTHDQSHETTEGV